MQYATDETNIRHVTLSLAGSGAGLSLWLLLEKLPDT
jgi:hypothetical protein